MSDFFSWIEDKNNGEWLIYAKRLAANDTGASGAKQVGVYVPAPVISAVFPSILKSEQENPGCYLEAQVSSHALPKQTVRVVYYNNKVRGGSRNEFRITRWKTGVKNNPIQNYDSTGALVFLAFRKPSEEMDSTFLDVWVCKSIQEEDFIEGVIGEVVPGQWIFEPGGSLLAGFARAPSYSATKMKIPAEWVDTFPTGEEIISYLVNNATFEKSDPDGLLLERRTMEYKLFRQVEEWHVLGQIKQSFNSVDDFMQLANSISNRRKSRSGRSLEIHLDHLFRQFGVVSFSAQCKTEGKKRPDFIFPSCSDYHNPDFPESRLRMLAVKTTCKDRWRQILTEADRVKKIYLLTLQEGVSKHQYQEMQSAGVTLVVPTSLHKKYHKDLRSSLMSLQEFIRILNE